MKRIGITQRVETIKEYGEKRDCLDQRWAVLAARLDWILHPIPNSLSPDAGSMIREFSLNGFILSGGNTPARLDPDAPDIAPERDRLESALIESAIVNSLPVLGVCRGMQMLNLYFGGQCARVEGHAGTRHALIAADPSQGFPDEVNSFHNWGIPDAMLAEGLIPLAHDGPGNVEALRHESAAIQGIMWHPEREQPFSDNDMRLLQKVFQ